MALSKGLSNLLDQVIASYEIDIEDRIDTIQASVREVRDGLGNWQYDDNNEATQTRRAIEAALKGAVDEKVTIDAATLEEWLGTLEAVQYAAEEGYGTLSLLDEVLVETLVEVTK